MVVSTALVLVIGLWHEPGIDGFVGGMASTVPALRNLFGNPGGVPPETGPWSLQHPVLYTAIWAVGHAMLMSAPRCLDPITS